MKEAKDVDPVEELHSIRRAIWKEAGGTPDAYARYYLEMSKKRIGENTTPTENAAIRKIDKRRKAVVP